MDLEKVHAVSYLEHYVSESDADPELAESVKIVLQRLAELEAQPVTVEYAVRWVHGPVDLMTEAAARAKTVRHEADGATLVRRTVGPWTPVAE